MDFFAHNQYPSFFCRPHVHGHDIVIYVLKTKRGSYFPINRNKSSAEALLFTVQYKKDWAVNNHNLFIGKQTVRHILKIVDRVALKLFRSVVLNEDTILRSKSPRQPHLTMGFSSSLWPGLRISFNEEKWFIRDNFNFFRKILSSLTFLGTIS